jgi:hypothetical protein
MPTKPYCMLAYIAWRYSVTDSVIFAGAKMTKGQCPFVAYRLCLGSLFAQGLALEPDTVRAVDDTIQDSLGQRGVVEHAVPMLCRELTGDDQRAGLHALIDNIQQGISHRGFYRCQSEVIEDE